MANQFYSFFWKCTLNTQAFCQNPFVVVIGGSQINNLIKVGRMSEVLYYKLVEIGVECLGPATQRWFPYLITAHLNKPAYEIQPADLPKLCLWAKITAALYTEDEKLIESFTGQIEALALTKERVERQLGT